MTDFFALFEAPRQPWLDAKELKQKYSQLTRAAHPDLRPRESAHFKEINQAYRVLLDPKRRIQHLLELEAALDFANHAVPVHLQELFPRVGEIAQTSRTLLEQAGNAAGVLSKALLKPELRDLSRKIVKLLDELRTLLEACLTELPRLNEIWNANRRHGIEQLRSLYEEISYLSRWIEQMEEARFQLSLC
jgi:curved DNA-binding protein CbpA